MDKFTGRAKGFAYLEFAAKVSPFSHPPSMLKDVFVRKKGEKTSARSMRPILMYELKAGVCVDGDGEEQRAAARSAH